MRKQIINGSFTSAVVYLVKNTETDIDLYAVSQLKMLCDNETAGGCAIRVMPDVHPGKVGVIGLTMTLGSRILPSLVGTDIGCGVTIAKLGKYKKDFQKLDAVIRERIPSGFSVRKKNHISADSFDFDRLVCLKHIKLSAALSCLGTLGGGNHFIELDKGEDDSIYLAVHSGSRYLGKEVAEWYLKLASEYLKAEGIDVSYELSWLEGDLKQKYLNDTSVVQEYASLNREIIIKEIAAGMKWKIEDIWSSVHNYIDMESELPLLRKGAISARQGQRLVIPVNMRDGIILGTGRGNKDWNYSAPHGSGRIFKREDTKNRFTLSEFKQAMKGIYSPSISRDTLDEAPFAYRALEEIKEAIGDTAVIQEVIRPIYNFKAGENN